MKRGKFDIYSPKKGKVKYALSTRSDYGNRVYIEYDDCILMFAHLEEFYVKEGQEVKTGELIGMMGDSGYGDDTHLHVSAFSKRARKLTAEWTIDPTFFLKLAPHCVCNTQVSNGYGSKYHNPKLNKHEGVDFSGVNGVEGYQEGVNPLFLDYRLKEDYPQEYN